MKTIHEIFCLIFFLSVICFPNVKWDANKGKLYPQFKAIQKDFFCIFLFRVFRKFCFFIYSLHSVYTEIIVSK